MKVLLYRLSHPDTGHIVSAGIVVGAGRCSLRAGAHAVTVVFTNEDARDIPQLGHIVHLVYLALVGCSVSEKRKADSIDAPVLGCKRNAYT